MDCSRACMSDNSIGVENSQEFAGAIEQCRKLPRSGWYALFERSALGHRSLLAKTFSYPKGPRWIQTPPPYDRVLERPYGLWIVELLHHSGLPTKSEAIGYLLLRKYDCTRVQVATPQAHILDPPAFRPAASVLTCPSISESSLALFSKYPLNVRRRCANT